MKFGNTKCLSCVCQACVEGRGGGDRGGNCWGWEIVSCCEGKRSPNQTHSTQARERGHCPVGHACILLFTVPERAVVIGT